MLATLDVPASAALFGLSPALLMDIAIKGSLVLLFALVAARLLRSASAATRHTVWAAAILAQLAIPALAGPLPEWRLAILPPAPADTPLAGAPVVAPTPTPSASPAPTPGVLPGRLTPGTAASVAPAVTPTPAPVAVPSAAPNAAAAPGAPVPTGRNAQRATRSVTGGLTLPDLLVLIWAVGGAAVLLRLSFGTLQVWRMARRSRRVTDPRWLALSQRIAEDVRLSRPLTLLQGSALTVPVTFGILFPVVLLPADAHLWPADRRRIVLLHEVAHVKRLDAFTQVVSQLVLAVFWFNPLVWVALKNMRAERERACDDYVLRGGMKPSVYVDDLIAMVRSIGATTGPAFAALAMARRSEFEGRMLAILDTSTSRRSAGRLAAVLTTLAVLLLAAPLAAMRAVPQSADNVMARRAQENARVRDDSAGLARRIADSIGRRIRGDGRGDAASIVVDVNPDPDPRVSVDVESAVEIELGMGQEKGEGKERGVGTGEGRGEGYQSPEARTAAVASLITAIGDEDGAVKLAAIQALGSLEDPRAVEALSEALRRDPDPEVREMAAWALGEIENAAAVPALSEALRGDREVAVRLKAAWALGEIESARGVEALGAALRDENVEVRRMAIWALGEIESPQAVPLLLPLLDEQDREVREKAAWALGEIESPQAVEGLTKALRDADVRVRETVVWALGEIESASAGPALAAALKDENVAVRRKAAWALGEIDGLDAAPPDLIAALGDTDREVRLQAARALGEIKDPAAVPALSTAARGQDEQLRRAAAWALSEMGDQAAVDVLIELLRSDDPEIRKAAAQALGKSN